MAAKKQKEFSKVLWAIALAHAAVVTLFAMVAMIVLEDLSALEV